MADEPKRRRKKSTQKKNDERPLCGLVMPISEIGGLSEKHWRDVKSILTDAMNAVGFDAKLVSDGGAAEVIQKRIVQNLYDCPIVVADISCLNPNVMFEVGMRLTFDKPAVLVVDDKTTSPFDIATIEYVPYRRDLRYLETDAFKRDLGEKVAATLEASKEDGHSTFLSHFGKFQVLEPQSEIVGMERAMLQQLEEMNSRMSRIESQNTEVSSEKGGTSRTVDLAVEQAIRWAELDGRAFDDETIATLKRMSRINFERIDPRRRRGHSSTRLDLLIEKRLMSRLTEIQKKN